MHKYNIRLKVVSGENNALLKVTIEVYFKILFFLQF